MSTNSVSKLIAQKASIIKDALDTTPEDLSALAALAAEKSYNQEIITKLLEAKGTKRLFDLIYHADESLRVAAVKLIHTLWRENEKTQVAICETCQFTPFTGKVVINRVPKQIMESLQRSAKPELISILKGAFFPSTVEGIWVYPEQHDVEGLVFPDPMQYLIALGTNTSKPKSAVGAATAAAASNKVTRNSVPLSQTQPVSRGSNTPRVADLENTLKKGGAQGKNAYFRYLYHGRAIKNGKATARPDYMPHRASLTNEPRVIRDSRSNSASRAGPENTSAMHCRGEGTGLFDEPEKRSVLNITQETSMEQEALLAAGSGSESATKIKMQ